MAKEYIEREAVLAAVDCTQVIVGDWIRNNIQKIPAADVRPVVHAHWIERDTGDGDAYYECSHCGEAWTLIDGTPKENNMAFCSRCGAFMDEEVDDG